MSAIRSPNRVRRLRYLLEVILKTLTFALTFSMSIRPREMRRFCAFSSRVSSPPFGFFLGVSLLPCRREMPW